MANTSPTKMPAKMPTNISPSQFDQLLLDQTPMFDVRAPIEFEKGAFPKVQNLPLMNDDERQQIGTCYKLQGQEAAIALGHELVHGAIKQQRVDAWRSFVSQQPNAVLYCFRGGLRSKVSQQWLAEVGINIPFVEGGYKALRSHLIERLDSLVEQIPAWVLSGRTGTGKTEILPRFERTIDLEGLAQHRGSSFGKNIGEQPSQIDFENSLAITLMRLHQLAGVGVIYEDESRLIGRCLLPLSLQAKLKASPIMVLEDDFEARVERLRVEYVVKAIAAWQTHLADENSAFETFSTDLKQSIFRIRKRLGGAAYKQVDALLDHALEQQSQHQDLAAHKHWISYLLTHYYDPMYDYQLSLKQERVVVKGTALDLVQWHQQQTLYT